MDSFEILKNKFKEIKEFESIANIYKRSKAELNTLVLEIEELKKEKSI